MHTLVQQLHRFIACTLLGLVCLAKPGLALQAIYCTYELDGRQSAVYSGVQTSGQWLTLDEKLLAGQLFHAHLTSGGNAFRVDRVTADKIVKKCGQVLANLAPRARFLKARTPYYGPMLGASYGYPVVYEYNAVNQSEPQIIRVGSSVLQHYLNSLHATQAAVMVVGTGAADEIYPNRYYRVDRSAAHEPDWRFDITSDALPRDHENQFDVVIFYHLPYTSWGEQQIKHALANAHRLLKLEGRLVSNMPLSELGDESQLAEDERGKLVQLRGVEGVKFSPAHPALAYVPEASSTKDSVLMTRAFFGAIGEKLNRLGRQTKLKGLPDQHWLNGQNLNETYFVATTRKMARKAL